MNNSMYWDRKELLGYNRFISMAVGGRSLGKSWQFLDLCFSDFIENDKEFIYLRRRESDLDFSDLMLEDLKKVKPNDTFRIVGKNIQWQDPMLEEWRTMGYIAALNTSYKIKGAQFPRVKWVWYEEFIDDPDAPSGYLKNELRRFTNLMSTIDRDEDRCRAIMSANATTIDNPYFSGFRLNPVMDTNKSTFYKNKLAVVEMIPASEKLLEKKTESNVGKLSKLTGDYDDVVLGVATDAGNDWIMQLTDLHFAVFNLNYNNRIYSVNYSAVDGTCVLSDRYKNDVVTIALDFDSQAMQQKVMSATDKQRELIRYSYRKGLLYYTDISIRNILREELRRCYSK